IFMKKIILASSSPRRKELLAKLDIDFLAVPAECEEKIESGEDPLESAARLSGEKAGSLVSKYPGHIIIGADTFAVLDKEILGKPHTAKEAERMLKLISGRVLLAITGFTIWDTGKDEVSSKTVSTEVYFKELTSREIDEYIATGEPLDKAGAFAIQGKTEMFIKKINGSYSNVVGLPLYELAEELKRFEVL
ncbi:MAG: Maf family protein, partial [Patescibacteria group bacterium]